MVTLGLGFVTFFLCALVHELKAKGVPRFNVSCLPPDVASVKKEK